MLRTRIIISAVSLIVAGALHQHFNAPLPPQLDAIEAAVTEIRGLAPLAETTLEFISREDYAARLAAKSAEESSPEDVEQIYLFYRALDLAPAGLDLQALAQQYLASRVVGVYHSDSQSISLIASSRRAPTGLLKTPSKLTYAHEYSHALQDQHFDLEAFFAPAEEADNFDLSLAMTALVEGDATNVEYDYFFELTEQNPLKAWLELEIAYSSPAPAPVDVPPILPQELNFIYHQGNEFIWALFEADDWGWTLWSTAPTPITRRNPANRSCIRNVTWRTKRLSRSNCPISARCSARAGAPSTTMPSANFICASISQRAWTKPWLQTWRTAGVATGFKSSPMARMTS